MDGIQVTSPQIVPICNTADSHEAMQEVTIIDYGVVSSKGLSRQC